MSYRSLIEFNHDRIPYDHETLAVWAEQLAAYFRSGDKSYLPPGATFFNIRHHSEDCPLGLPPYGWENDE